MNVHQSAGAGEATPWVIAGSCATGMAGLALAQIGGALASWFTGHGYHQPPYTARTLIRLIFRGPGPLWPGVPPDAVITGIAAAETAGIATLITMCALIWRALGGPLGLATRWDVRHLTFRRMAKRARALRPSLGEHPARHEVGILLGRMGRRRRLYSSWEDVILALMGPRAGKTSGLAVPAILDAPGPVIATSNRADVLQITSQARAEVGRVWVFDPQGIAFSRQAMWWDMLDRARDIEGAQRLAGAFVSVAADASYRHDFWFGAARNTLVALFHAAARSGASIQDVLAWLANPLDRAPIIALRAAGMHILAGQLAGTIAGAPETRDGIFETARQCVACLLDPRIAQWVTPHDDLPRFDPTAFMSSRDTVYLLSKDGGGSAAGLVTAATDALLQAAIGEAERQGGRMDPPCVPVLDEVANIARIEDLPDLFSHLGSRSIPCVTVLQSYRQGVKAWGEPGMDALWSAATTKLLGAGLDDSDFAAKMSLLVGDHEIWRRSSSFGGSNGSSTSVQQHDKRGLQASDIRRIAKGHALLLATATKIAHIELFQWHQGARAAQLNAAFERERAAIRARANAAFARRTES
jgi:hypothetical protein